MSDFTAGGVILSPIVPATLLALVLTVALSFLLARLRFFRLVWHRPLVEVAIFLMLLAAGSLLAPWGPR